MKRYSIKIGNREFEYRIFTTVHDGGEYSETKFYEQAEVDEKKWNWRKFRMVKTGNRITIMQHAFSLYHDIHCTRTTKSEIRKLIEREVKLLNRRDEIARGEVI